MDADRRPDPSRLERGGDARVRQHAEPADQGHGRLEAVRRRLDVPNEARGIAFGILLAGAGQAWMDELQFEAVGADVPVTGAGAPAKKPNLSFQP